MRRSDFRNANGRKFAFDVVRDRAKLIFGKNRRRSGFDRNDFLTILETNFEPFGDVGDFGFRRILARGFLDLRTFNFEREIPLSRKACGLFGDDSFVLGSTPGLCFSLITLFLFGPNFRFDFSPDASFQVCTISSRGFNSFTFFLFRSQPCLFFPMSFGFLFGS